MSGFEVQKEQQGKDFVISVDDLRMKVSEAGRPLRVSVPSCHTLRPKGPVEGCPRPLTTQSRKSQSAWNKHLPLNNHNTGEMYLIPQILDSRFKYVSHINISLNK